MDERVTRPEPSSSSSDEATELLDEENEVVEPELLDMVMELEPEKLMDEVLESERVESTEMSESSLL